MTDPPDDAEREREAEREHGHTDVRRRDGATESAAIGRGDGSYVERTMQESQPGSILPLQHPAQTRHRPSNFRSDRSYLQSQTTTFDLRGMRAALPYSRAAPFDLQQYNRAQHYPHLTPSNVAAAQSFRQQVPQGHPLAGMEANYAGSLATHGQSYPPHFPQHSQPQHSAAYHYGRAGSTYYSMPPHFPSTTFSHTPVVTFGPNHGYSPPSNAPLPTGGVGRGTMLAESVIPTTSQTNASTEASGRHGIEASAISSTLRGPPKKPRQSGYALWCGNLPVETKITELKDYFSRDATDDIESVFLIAKSSCAFVNYKSEASCTAALTRFHDSRFRGSKVVCRLRKLSAVGPARASTTSQTQSTPEMAEQSLAAIADRPAQDHLPEDIKDDPTARRRTAEKFFVLKSLTVEDLDASLRTGSWATQSHNEAALNIGYQTVDNVYLVFSANKSGEYYGCAKMASGIEDTLEAQDTLGPRPMSSLAPPADSSITTFTPATEHAPKGYIIDDPTRGTIFWEADRDDHSEADNPAEESRAMDAVESESSQQTLGRPFRIQWLSTQKVPFHRARGLRNPWNQNREVKIARDGTEIEPLVGRRLINLFFHPAPHGGSNVHNLAGGPPPHMLTAMHPPMLSMAYPSDPRLGPLYQ